MKPIFVFKERFDILHKFYAVHLLQAPTHLPIIFFHLSATMRNSELSVAENFRMGIDRCPIFVFYVEILYKERQLET